jgi:hypothetical protein
MNQTENEDDFRLRDRIAFRVMEHLITRSNSELHMQSSDEKVDNIARLAYKMADSMCKQRLIAFI